MSFTSRGHWKISRINFDSQNQEIVITIVNCDCEKNVYRYNIYFFSRCGHKQYLVFIDNQCDWLITACAIAILHNNTHQARCLSDSIVVCHNPSLKLAGWKFCCLHSWFAPFVDRSSIFTSLFMFHIHTYDTILLFNDISQKIMTN